MRRPLLLLTCAPFLLQAQQLDYDWSGVISSAGPGSAGYIDDLEVNSLGNAVGYGYFGGSTGFDLDIISGGYPITANAENAFLCIYDGNGGILMGGPLTSEERVFIHDLELLPDGFLIVATASAPVDMEPLFGLTDVSTSNTGGGEFMIVARYSMEGSLLWALPVDGNYSTFRSEIAVRPDGSFYLTADIGSAGANSYVDLDLGPGESILELFGGRSIITYQDPDGDLVWHHDHGTGIPGGGTTPVDNRTDGEGSLLVVGLQDSDVDFDPAPGDQTTLLMGPTAYVAKYTANGQLAWVRTITGVDVIGNAIWATNVLVNEADDIIVSGRFFQGSVDLDPGAGEELVASAGGHDIWMMRFDPAGNRIWGRTYGTTANDISEDMCFLGNGDILLGQKDQVVPLEAFPLSIISATNGDVIQQFPQPWQQSIGALAGGYGQVYISGQFNGLAMGDLTSGNVVLTGSDDIHLSHYTSEITTSLDDQEGPTRFTTGPSPASDRITIRASAALPPGTEIQVRDAAGRSVRSIPWAGNGTVLEVGDLAPGTYFLLGAGPASHRFVVAR